MACKPIWSPIKWVMTFPCPSTSWKNMKLNDMDRDVLFYCKVWWAIFFLTNRIPLSPTFFILTNTKNLSAKRLEEALCTWKQYFLHQKFNILCWIVIKSNSLVWSQTILDFMLTCFAGLYNDDVKHFLLFASLMVPIMLL